MHPLYYDFLYDDFFLRIRARLTIVIGLHMVYLLFKEGVLDESRRNTCELLTTRKERNDYLFNFYLSRVSLNAFMEFLRSPDSNVDAILLEYIKAEIAALHVRVKRRRKTAPKRLPSPEKEEAAAEGELRDLLKKPRNSTPVAGTSFVPMTLPVSLPPTTEPNHPPPPMSVGRHPPSFGSIAQPSHQPSPPTSYQYRRRQKLPHNHHACYHHHHHMAYPLVLWLRHSPVLPKLHFQMRHRMLLSTAASGYQPLYTPINHRGHPSCGRRQDHPTNLSAATLSPSRGWWLCTN